MPRHHHALTAGVLLALALTACGTTPATSPSPSTPTPDSTTGSVSPADNIPGQPTASPAPAVSGPKTASAFGPAVWAIKPNIDAVATAKAHVFGNRVVLRTATETVAYDSQGKEVWRITHNAPTPATIVPMSPTVIGLVNTGKSDDSGLAQSKPQMQVRVVNLTDGTTIAERTIVAASNVAPELTTPGLGLTNFQGPTQAITSDGTVHTVEGVDQAGTVGDTVIRMRNQVVSTGRWTSDAFWDDPRLTNASIIAANTTNLLLIRGQSGLDHHDVLIDAATGDEYARPTCVSGIAYKPMTSSPNGKWNVIDGAIISPDHEVTCIGGGEGQKQVNLFAVTDQGRAFGTTTQGTSLLVDAHPGGTPTTEELAPGAVLPAGVIDGDLAVHWDPSAGVLSANPIQG